MSRPGPRPRPRNYHPLADSLATQQGSTLRLAFPEIETILRFPLPNTAHVNHSWWRDTVYTSVQTWTNRGWEARLRIGERSVVFTRTTAAAE